MRYYILIPLMLAPLAAACTPESMAAPDPNGNASASAMPAKQIEQIMGVGGTLANNVLKITIPRTDIGNVQGPAGVTFTPAFEIHGELYFQTLAPGRVLLNGYMALLEPEVNPFIASLLQAGIVFQAFHQNLPMNPQVWYVNFRTISEVMTMARAVRAAMDAAHIRPPQQASPQQAPPQQAPPQQAPQRASSLDAQRLAGILHGTAEVGAEGVVTVTVPRTDRVLLAGVRVSPYAGISTEIEFKPTGSGANAQVCPDFSMTSAEVNPVVRRMLLEFHWYQGSLRNDEIDQQPQLFYDAMVKEGDAYQLAQEIRAGLDLTHASRGPRS